MKIECSINTTKVIFILRNNDPSISIEYEIRPLGSHKSCPTRRSITSPAPNDLIDIIRDKATKMIEDGYNSGTI